MATLKRTLAVITGGNVAEREISLKSAETVAKHLDPSKYEVFILDLIGSIFIDKQSGARVDLNDFSLDLGDRKVTFDAVYLMLHGHPAEDGRLQGYFELLGIPYTGCDPLVSALTFDKQACKDFLKSHGIPMAPSALAVARCAAALDSRRAATSRPSEASQACRRLGSILVVVFLRGAYLRVAAMTGLRGSWQ